MSDKDQKENTRCTEAEAKKRKRVVMKLLLKGYPRSDILQYMTTEYGIKERQIDRYIKKATEQIQDDARRKRKAGVDYRIGKRIDLYKKAYSEHNWKLCLEIERDLAKLEGLYEENINLNVGGKMELKRKDETEIEEKIKEILDK